MSRLDIVAVLGATLVAACSSSLSGEQRDGGAGGSDASSNDATAGESNDAAGDGAISARLPLVLVADVDLPGGATRFDYQDVDPDQGHLIVTHMNDGSVLFLDLGDGSVLKEVKNIPAARGVVVADDVGLVFVTSSPSSLVLIDNKTMTETTRVGTGRGPDGVGWDPEDKVVGVSDQVDGALSLIPDSGNGTRKQIELGIETGNAIFDPSRGVFWITVVAETPPDQLVGIDPVAAEVKTTIDLPGCSGAHGLRLHPDGKTAFVACEANSLLARVDLAQSTVIATAPTGMMPDVMEVDPGLGWIYVAAEDGDLTVFDITQPGVVPVGHHQPGPYAHSVAVDPATHRVFFPLQAGPNGTPVLRIMKPSGI